ncbi:hypothetical protein KKC17_04185 [Patescibacteria group bacterium]|nr:hypothetical protein [Patescibacteria group bacterium]
MKKESNKRIILVFVGEKLAGKEMSARYLIKKYGFKGYRFSKLLVDILRTLDLPVTRLNEANLVGALRERFGGGVLAQAIKNKLQLKKDARVVIDGLRHPIEYEILKSLAGFKLIYLTAPVEVRFKRAKSRSEKVGESKFSLADFKREEKLPTELFIRRLGKKADVKLVNDKDLIGLYRQIDEKIMGKKNLKK